MKNFLLGLSKFVLGIILAMLIMSLAGLSMMRYFMVRMVEQPERPAYENDLPETDRPVVSAPDAGDGEEEVRGPEVIQPDEVDADDEPDVADDQADRAEAGAEGDIATVNQSVGLIVRSGPGTDYENVGGLNFQEDVEVIGEEGGWLNIIYGNGAEGWIKDGNVDR